jgi:hypothetical protein
MTLDTGWWNSTVAAATAIAVAVGAASPTHSSSSRSRRGSSNHQPCQLCSYAEQEVAHLVPMRLDEASVSDVSLLERLLQDG